MCLSDTLALSQHLYPTDQIGDARVAGRPTDSSKDVPDNIVPDGNVPEGNVPDVNVPDENFPDENVPDENS